MDGRNEVSVGFVGSLPGVTGIRRHPGNEVGFGEIGIGENISARSDRSKTAKRVVRIRHPGTSGYAIADGVARCAAKCVVGAGDGRAVLHLVRKLADAIVGVEVCGYAVADGGEGVPEAVVGQRNVRRRVRVVLGDEATLPVVGVVGRDAARPGATG